MARKGWLPWVLLEQQEIVVSFLPKDNRKYNPLKLRYETATSGVAVKSSRV